MKSICGDLGLMTLPDIMQWAEVNKKTGSLSIKHDDIVKTFYLQEGKIIFISSNEKGERLGEFLSKNCVIEARAIKEAITESQKLDVSLTGYLISEEIIEASVLENSILGLAETVFTDALQWQRGIFEFTDSVPSTILNGPVKLNTSFVVFQSMKQYDEEQREKSPDVEEIIRNMSVQISEESIDLPPAPDIMVKLNEYMQRDDSSVQDIVRLMMSDQILTSKILKVVNSAFYSPPSQITSLQQAIVYMGLKSIISLVAVHTLSDISPKNAGAIKKILQHSLLCAFLSKKIGAALRIDPEEAFVCGLLHDIGKTVIVNIVSDYMLPEEVKGKVVQDYHQDAGSLVAEKWNFSEVVWHVVKYHHNPEKASAHKKTVETVYLADVLSNNPETPPESLLGNCTSEGIRTIGLTEILGELDDIRNTVSSIM